MGIRKFGKKAFVDCAARQFAISKYFQSSSLPEQAFLAPSQSAAQFRFQGGRTAVTIAALLESPPQGFGHAYRRPAEDIIRERQ
jgi:hypothetical protein